MRNEDKVRPAQCQRYAVFLSGLNIVQANAVFWTLFLLTLFMMCIASFQNHKSLVSAPEENDFATRAEFERARRRINRLHEKHLVIVSGCLAVTVVCTIVEALAAFNIEYCDGEDLMHLYWGFWSVLQVGSIIAILGVLVHIAMLRWALPTPSWNVGLGTPVLVFAGSGWAAVNLAKMAWHKGWPRWRPGHHSAGLVDGPPSPSIGPYAAGALDADAAIASTNTSHSRPASTTSNSEIRPDSSQLLNHSTRSQLVAKGE